jgi:isopenicillin N synthase-like dioxygenase
MKILDLPEISLQKLEESDHDEHGRLLSAGMDFGFFYLKLNGSTHERLFSLHDQILQVSKDYFSQPMAKKMADLGDSHGNANTCGYVTVLNRMPWWQKRTG